MEPQEQFKKILEEISAEITEGILREFLKTPRRISEEIPIGFVKKCRKKS